jgi:OOP family OmpA-OmpF porin
VGDSGKNQELSETRARAVASYLVKKGVAAERITATGYGDTRPLVPQGNDVRNRRVEFIIRE